MESFIALIDELNACCANDRASLEARLAATFEVECAVLALDMSGYSSLVRRNGILPHLCRIRRTQLLTAPLIERFAGRVVRQVADNILAVFETANFALEAARAIVETAAQNGSSRDDAQRDLLPVSIGIDYGKLLLVPGYDCFGDPVNVAFKLGEDVAGPGEILITENGLHRLAPASRLNVQERHVAISGIELLAFKVC